MIKYTDSTNANFITVSTQEKQMLTQKNSTQMFSIVQSGNNPDVPQLKTEWIKCIYDSILFISKKKWSTDRC